MKLFCGSDLSEHTNDTLYQFEEGKRAHTVKFNPYPMENITNINSLNNKRIIKFPQNNKQININKNKEVLSFNIKNNEIKESNKLSNDASELEIIEYPINEIEKNENKTNNIMNPMGKNKINDKCQNNIINYLKNKPGYNRLNYLLEDDNSNIESNSEEKYNVKDDSSKSDEIICSYIEIDNSNTLENKIKKGNDVIKNSSKIFSQIHKATHSNYSFALKFNNNSCNHKKTKKIRKATKTKTDNFDKKINNLKKIKKAKANNNMIIDKLMLSKKILQPRESFNVKIEKKHISKKVLDEKNTQNKKGKFINNLKALNSFRTIEHVRNISIADKSLIKEKTNVFPRKSHKLNTEIVKHYFQLRKTITVNNRINSKEKYDNTGIFKTIKRTSNNKGIKRIKNKYKLIDNTNTLFKSIDIKRNKNIKKSHFLTFKKDLLNSKRNTIISKNGDSKGKLRKLLLNKNKMNTSKPIIDISMNNINNLNNNMNLLIKREKNKTVNKLMNKSEANKEINNQKKNKSLNKNNKKENINNKNMKGILVGNTIS